VQAIAIANDDPKASYFGPPILDTRPANLGRPVSPWAIVRS
jgi:hypothetical protein